MREAGFKRKHPASIAKISRPVFAGHLRRKRLFRKLDDLRRHPILWISGPAGSGKTALASSYLEARKIPCLWYRVDEDDADIATFFHYLGRASQLTAPRRKEPLPVFSPEYLPAVSRFAERYFEELCGRLTDPSVLVFDGFERLGDRSAVLEAFRGGFSRLPDGVSAVVISRSGPPPVFSRDRASQRIGFLGWKDLRLTLEETEGIARLHARKKMSAENVRYLQHKSDGWAAGLVLLLVKTETENMEPQSLSRQTPEEIFDYFAREMFDGIGPRTRRFLVRTAFFPKFSAKMAHQLTGRGNAARILAAMSKRHYFTESYQDSDDVFRYHSLFREFLLSRGKKEFFRQDLSRIRSDAAAILEKSGQIEDAVPLLREGRDWEGLALLIQNHAHDFVRQGRREILLEWMEDLPREVVGKNPWLMYWRGICRMPLAPEESRSLFGDAFRDFRLRSDPEGEFLSWAGIVNSIIHGPGNLKLLDPWFATLGELMQRHRLFPSDEIEARVTCAALKGISLRRPPSVDMESWSKRAAALGRSTGDTTLAFSLLLNLANHCFHAGDLQAVSLHLDSLRGVSRKPEIPPLSLLEMHWLEAAHANLAGEHEHCREVVAEGLALSEATGIRLKDLLLMGHGALSNLHLGDRKAAQGFLRKMASSLPRAGSWEAAFYHFLASGEALHRGDQAQARFHSERCLALCAEVGNPWTEALANLQSAFVLDREGEAAEASRRLERASRLGEERGMEFVRFLSRLATAYLRLGKGSGEDGLASLREGLRIGKEKGYVGIYLWHPGLLERIAGMALERGIEADYVKELIRRRSLLPDGPILEADRWPWPVEVHTFGRFGIVVDGRKIPAPRKAQQKPLRMLKALIALGGRGVSEERLGAVLWPDADGDQVHHSFSTTLQRLRRLLGSEKALVLSDGHLTLSNRHCWVDVWAFERFLGSFERAREVGRREAVDADCARLIEKAIALYQGPFLSGDAFCPCIESHRERLRSKFLRCVGAAGRHLESAGQWEKALLCYQKGLEVDDLAEELYRRLMVCHRELGRTAEALAVYYRCRRKLTTVLRVNPSPETEAVFRSLRSPRTV